MDSILNLMTHDHRSCDQHFADIEDALAVGDKNGGRAAFQRFSQALLAHFDAEESLLFPRFESVTGMRSGPTQVMCLEHENMRAQLRSMHEALIDDDLEGFAGEAETLLVMMQQHNMKEENILYPMCDNHLAAELDTLEPALAGKLGHARP